MYRGDIIDHATYVYVCVGVCVYVLNTPYSVLVYNHHRTTYT